MGSGTHRLTAGEPEVHVWQADLDAPPWREAASGLLSGDERERARRFLRPIDRDRFTVSRGLLRMVLGEYAGTRPEDLMFHYGPHGKPSLAGPGDAARWRFNVSHAGGAWAAAVSLEREVGIDVERIREDVEVERLASTTFAPAETQALLALARPTRRRAFFAVWTRKEAYIKAVGQGLSIPLDGFAVSIDPAGPARLLRTDWRPEDVHRWELRDLHVPPGHAGAIAVASGRHECKVIYRDVASL